MLGSPRSHPKDTPGIAARDSVDVILAVKRISQTRW